MISLKRPNDLGAAEKTTKTLKPPGRQPKYDWEALYKEFLTSGMTKHKFLMTKGIATNHPSARGWAAHVGKTREAIKALIAEREREVPGQLVDLFALVKTMSMGLAVKHYKPAEFAIMHIEIQLEKSFIIDEATGQITGSRLTPREMRQLLGALADAQKIQRLALGLSTDNIANHGQPTPGDGSHVEKNATPGAPGEPEKQSSGPVFVVEVNANGKFIRPRPRLALGVRSEASAEDAKPSEEKT